MRTSSPFHAVTWLLWASSAAATVQLAPSPLYVVLVLAITALVVDVHRLDSLLSRAFPLLLGAGVVFALLRVVLTALTTHTGSSHAVVWARLPEGTLPRLLGGFTVGGPIEATVVLRAAAEGLAIVGIMAAFGAFNAVASHYELLQAAPRAFHEPGLIVTVALAFVPSTLGSVAAVREADRARTGGRVVRRGRLVRIAIPILESGMERAVALAESMDARGFARLPATAADRVAGWIGLVSLLGLGGAFVALVGQTTGLALGLSTGSLAGLVAAIWLASSGNRPTRYRPRRLARVDLVMGGVALLAPIGLVVLGAAGHGATLQWTPATPLAFPTFSVLPALCVMLLAAPAAWPARAATASAAADRPVATERARDRAAADLPNPSGAR